MLVPLLRYVLNLTLCVCHTFTDRNLLWPKLPQALQIPHLKRAQSIIARYDAGDKSSIAEIARGEFQDIRTSIIDRVAEEQEAEEARRETEARAKAEQAKAAEIKAAQQEEEALGLAALEVWLALE